MFFRFFNKNNGTLKFSIQRMHSFNNTQRNINMGATASCRKTVVHVEQDHYDYSSEWVSYIDEHGQQTWWNWRTQQITHEPQYSQYYYENGHMHDTYAEEDCVPMAQPSEQDEVPMAQPSEQDEVQGPLQRYQLLPPIGQRQ